MGERGDRIRRYQHHRLSHRRLQQEAREGLPGGVAATGPRDVPGGGKGERFGAGRPHVRRRVRPRRGVQQAAEEEAGRLQEQLATVQQRQQAGVGLQRVGGLGHALGARG